MATTRDAELVTVAGIRTTGPACTLFLRGGFTTDPAYTATESTLIAYSGWTTC